MKWLDDLVGLSRRTRTVVALVGAIAGLAGVIVGIATGSMLLLVPAYAVVLGVRLLPAVLDWRGAQLDVEMIRQRNKSLTVVEKRVPELIIEHEIDAGGMVFIEPEQHRVH